LRPPRESESSESEGAELCSSEPSLLSESLLVDLGSDLAAPFFARFGATASTGAAWKIGTGIAAAFLRVLGVASASDVATSATSGEVSLLLLFFTARLRGDFGSIAMAPNPLARTF
jgi:hypothetical protein